MGKWIIIDGHEYQVALTDLQRKGNVLDLTANRTEDGVLHREVIGTYYNYSMTFIAPTNHELYEQFWWVITAPVASHSVQLPYQPAPFTGYFSSCKDDIKLIDKSGRFIGMGISCNLTATRPSRSA